MNIGTVERERTSKVGEGNQSLFGEEVLSFTILSLVCHAVLEIHLDPGLVANAICGGKKGIPEQIEGRFERRCLLCP